MCTKTDCYQGLFDLCDLYSLPLLVKQRPHFTCLHPAPFCASTSIILLLYLKPAVHILLTRFSFQCSLVDVYISELIFINDWWQQQLTINEHNTKEITMKWRQTTKRTDFTEKNLVLEGVLQKTCIVHCNNFQQYFLSLFSMFRSQFTHFYRATLC